jgi:peptide/nickel transport system substrate-binding protein
MPNVSPTRVSLSCLIVLGVLTGASSAAATRMPAAPQAKAAQATQAAQAPARGGALVATMRSEPRSFNPHAGRDFASTTVGLLLHARLVRVNRATQLLEPSLAESFTCAPDALSCTFKLRQNVTWSDGTPFSTADVIFSFQVLYDEKTASWMVDDFMPGGKPLVPSAPDARTIVVKFGAPYGPGARLLDKLPILPKHKLEAALKAGTLRQQWGAATPPADLVGLGPFVLQEYRPGERVVFVRNPRYWKKDAKGVTLPYLDRLSLEIVPDQNTELLRLQSGQADLTQTEIRADDYAVLKRQATAGKITLMDAGVALDADAFWFNLKPAAKANDPRRAWLQSLELRKAVSHAVDRRAFADAVFLGAAEPQWGPVTPGNKTWFAPAGVVERHAFDRAKAKTLLAAVGLRDVNNDGLVEDASGQAARFTLITQKGNTALEKGAAVLRDDLKAIGLTMDVVPLEVGALVERLQKAEYDALYYRFLNTDTDPSGAMDFWLSSGGAHVWNTDQATPGTAWEKAIDAAMQRVVATGNLPARQKAFNEAQKLFSDNLPVVYFAAARLYVAASTRVVGAVPAPLRPSILWNAEALRVR